ncbi:hypothetical protein GQ44DRAFT_739916 [Phaeosphaeriaceae sp. PMI808]|nr:hypothetical protein GQ44DRAFT_739916 [Phaeosphaeriaceae sp. PMI808]
MNLAPLAQSTDKQVLFARLGLNEQIHKILLSEAQSARDALSQDPQNLTDQSRVNQLVQAPYKWDELSETAKHRAILTVVENAPPHTRYYYAMGRYQTNVNEENWVARWYLWHSFRYRDNRDTRSRATAGSSVSDYRGGSAGGAGGYFDPIHNTYR